MTDVPQAAIEAAAKALAGDDDNGLPFFRGEAEHALEAAAPFIAAAALREAEGLSTEVVPHLAAPRDTVRVVPVSRLRARADAIDPNGGGQ